MKWFSWRARKTSDVAEEKRKEPGSEEEPTLRSLEATEHRDEVALIIAAVGLYLLALVVGYAPFAEIQEVMPHMRHFVKDSIFAIATACLVSVLFSRLIDLPTATRVVAKNLADILFGDEYLKRTRRDLPDLRRRIDKVHLGAWAVADKRSLYNFIQEKLDPFYISDFRRDYTIQLSIKQKEDAFIWHDVTEYTLVRNVQHKVAEPIEFSSGVELGPRTLKRIQGTDAVNAILRSVRVTVGDITYVSKSGEPATLMNGDLIASNVTCKAVVEEKVFGISVSCQLTADQMSVEEIFVRLEMQLVVNDFHDDLYYARVVRPTLGFTFLATLPWPHRIEVTKFGFENLGDMTHTGGVEC